MQLPPSPPPPWLQGRRIPFGLLGHDQFQALVARLFVTGLAEARGWEVVALPPEGADQGFDVWARDRENAAVCIQAKRYAANLGVAAVSLEIAKVALNAHLHSWNVCTHLIITAGELTQELTHCLGNDTWHPVIESAVNQATSHAELAALRKRFGHADFGAIVRKHAYSLAIHVWSGRMLDEEVGARMSAVGDVLGDFFAIRSVLRERPRPDFHERDYLHRLRMAPEARLNLLAQLRTDGHERTEVDALEVFRKAKPGELHVVFGPGGAGKTSLLREAAALLAAGRESGVLPTLPVLLDLGIYRGDFDALVHRRMGVTFGHWSSVPGPVALLLDGLDRVPPDYVDVLWDELARVDVAKAVLVLSTRASGRRGAEKIERASHVWALLPPSAAEIHKHARARLGSPRASEFLEAFWDRGVRTDVLGLPFGIEHALTMFERGLVSAGDVPSTLQHLVDAKLRRTVSPVPRLPILPPITIAGVVEATAFVLRVEGRTATMSVDEFARASMDIVERLRHSKLAGSDSITSLDVYSILTTHGICTRTVGDYVEFVHDLELDFFAAKPLAGAWREHISLLSDSAFDELWVFAARHVSQDEWVDFVATVTQADLVLASRAAQSARRPESLHEHLASAARLARTDFDRSTLLMATRVCGTERALAILRATGRQERTSKHEGFATRELLRLGDEEAVAAALIEMDKIAASPIRYTSTITVAWPEVPPTARLKAARRRLLEKPSFVGVSIETVAAFGDQRDAPLVHEALEALRDPDIVIQGAVALASLDRSDATDLLNILWERLSHRRRALVAEALRLVGQPYDAQPLIDDLLDIDEAELSPTVWVGNKSDLEAPGGSGLTIYDITSLCGALRGTSLQEHHWRALSELREQSDTFRSGEVWKLAGDVRYLGWIEAALCAIQQHADTAVCEANYLLHVVGPDDVRTRDALELGLRDYSTSTPPPIAILELAARHGLSALVRPIVRQQIVALLDAMSIGERVSDEMVGRALEYLRVAPACASLSELLPIFRRGRLPTFGNERVGLSELVANASEEEFRAIANAVPRGGADSLEMLPWLLGASSALPWWQCRRALLVEIAAQMLGSFPAAQAVARALDVRWDEDVVHDIVIFVATLTSRQSGRFAVPADVFVHDLGNVFAKRMHSGHTELLLAASAAAQDPSIALSFKSLAQALRRTSSRQAGEDDVV